MQRDKVHRIIGMVEDYRLRNLLGLKYISGYSFEHIAVELNYCYKHTCRLHNEALQAVKEVLECPIQSVV